ncbi:spermidine synthase [Arcanobacterium buesumense]|uniref:Fused MFS/spermidine synthase n=1 Tax=Arcanobacterium buesumense TaxID=2722751 RepID=A0A6H2EL03_9ACTO|nr:fused MFS/spermidine synthase [Arcanobacterium buesumense]QJC21601.1 fused MFS/spermidine synthase [Arcanobacterium buesumense]
MARKPTSEIIQTSMSTLRIETRDTIRTLFIDDVESSAIDLSDPTYLEFEYMQHISVAVTATYQPPASLRILHLGGAGCALARCFAAQYPQSRQLAIEIDPELALVAREHFDLPSSPELRIRTQDARQTLETNKGSWHVIIRDAFAGGQVPAHLATSQAYASAGRLLREDGVYCVNIAGQHGLVPLYREVQSARETFAHITAIADPAIVKKRRMGNIVLLASHHPIDTANIDRNLRALAMPARLIPQEQIERQAIGHPPFTDEEAGWQTD